MVRCASVRGSSVKVFPACLLGVVLGTLLCPAAGASDPVAACTNIADAAARLECYDRASGRKVDAGAAAGAVAGTAAAASAQPVVAAPQAAAPPVDSTATFGLSREKIAEVQQESGELKATVASVANHSQPGRWVVTLDNGQVWEQRETTPASRRPQPGDRVTITTASLGSYLLTAPGRGSNRVRRVC